MYKEVAACSSCHVFESIPKRPRTWYRPLQKYTRTDEATDQAAMMKNMEKIFQHKRRVHESVWEDCVLTLNFAAARALERFREGLLGGLGLFWRRKDCVTLQNVSQNRHICGNDPTLVSSVMYGNFWSDMFIQNDNPLFLSLIVWVWRTGIHACIPFPCTEILKSRKTHGRMRPAPIPSRPKHPFILFRASWRIVGT